MKGFYTDIEKDTIKNDHYRKVLYSSKHMQLVLMTLQPGEEIGTETHKENAQFFRIEEGQGKCIIDGHEYDLKDGDVIIVPSGAKHNVINTSEKEKLKLYTIYSPPHHLDKLDVETKAEADSLVEEFDGITTE